MRVCEEIKQGNGRREEVQKVREGRRENERGRVDMRERRRAEGKGQGGMTNRNENDNGNGGREGGEKEVRMMPFARNVRGSLTDACTHTLGCLAREGRRRDGRTGERMNGRND